MMREMLILQFAIVIFDIVIE